jgi:hypothetical protein
MTARAVVALALAAATLPTAEAAAAPSGVVVFAGTAYEYMACPYSGCHSTFSTQRPLDGPVMGTAQGLDAHGAVTAMSGSYTAYSACTLDHPIGSVGFGTMTLWHGPVADPPREFAWRWQGLVGVIDGDLVGAAVFRQHAAWHCGLGGGGATTTVNVVGVVGVT